MNSFGNNITLFACYLKKQLQKYMNHVVCATPHNYKTMCIYVVFLINQYKYLTTTLLHNCGNSFIDAVDVDISTRDTSAWRRQSIYNIYSTYISSVCVSSIKMKTAWNIYSIIAQRVLCMCLQQHCRAPFEAQQWKVILSPAHHHHYSRRALN